MKNRPAFGGGGQISWGRIFGAKEGIWRLGGDAGEQEEAAKCSADLHRWDTGSAAVGQLCRAGWEYSLLRASKGRKHSA